MAASEEQRSTLVFLSCFSLSLTLPLISSDLSQFGCFGEDSMWAEFYGVQVLGLGLAIWARSGGDNGSLILGLDVVFVVVVVVVVVVVNGRGGWV
ncbi:hypothetical protein Ddye_018331 [Dipteronia dyeriana]|uniref:NADH dehydrogenase subunit 6 n=1 Tax=Dipteronia dyeriana TaxID=168575 RepID=A0AAD9UAE6_9ROSI|nr:hypothetical protein Ddye_018331 [Dipteronia dyeriana]